MTKQKQRFTKKNWHCKLIHGRSKSFHLWRKYNDKTATIHILSKKKTIRFHYWVAIATFHFRRVRVSQFGAYLNENLTLDIFHYIWTSVTLSLARALLRWLIEINLDNFEKTFECVATNTRLSCVLSKEIMSQRLLTTWIRKKKRKKIFH